MAMRYAGVELEVVHGDALRYPSDLLVLKYAQQSYGVDQAAVRVAGIGVSALPANGSSLLVPDPRQLSPRNLLFLGVESLHTFGYGSIRKLARRAVSTAS